MTEQPHGPIYEYMMGTIDLHDATWMSSMNDMLNNYGLAGWKRSVVTMLNARYLLVVMERRFPSAAEYPRSERLAALTREPVAVPDAEVTEFLEEFDHEDGREPQPQPDTARQGKYRTLLAAEMASAEAEADEYDAEGEALMAAKVAEVVPWARRKAPANGRRRKRAALRKKAVAVAPKAGS